MHTETNPSGAVGGEGGGATAGAQAKAQDVAGQAQEKARAATGQARVKVREQLDQRSSQLSEQINQQASDLRSVSGALRDQGKDGPAKGADRLAGYAEQVGGYLRDKDAEAMLRDAEDFGRRQPLAVVAGGLALGFAASRFLKASSSKRYALRDGAQRATPPAALPASTGQMPVADPVLPRSPDGFEPNRSGIS